MKATSSTFIYNQTSPLSITFFSSLPPLNNTPALLCSVLPPLATPPSCHYSWLPFVSFDPFLRTSPVCRGRLYLHPEEMAAGIPANLECVCVCVCFILFPLVPQWAEVYGTLQLARPSLQCYFYACVYLHVRISVCACMQIWVHKT